MRAVSRVGKGGRPPGGGWRRRNPCPGECPRFYRGTAARLAEMRTAPKTASMDGTQAEACEERAADAVLSAELLAVAARPTNVATTAAKVRAMSEPAGGDAGISFMAANLNALAVAVRVAFSNSASVGDSGTGAACIVERGTAGDEQRGGVVFADHEDEGQVVGDGVEVGQGEDHVEDGADGDFDGGVDSADTVASGVGTWAGHRLG